jgi:hypothetical protein
MKDNRLLSTRAWLAALAALVIVASFALSYQVAPKPAASVSAQPLRDIEQIDTLRDQFNRDAGLTRLILLVSPT